MKTFTLCCVGFLAGTAAAFITQTPVMETLGYAPKPETTATSTTLDGIDTVDPARQAIVSEETNVSEDPSAAEEIRAKNLAAYSEAVDELPMSDDSEKPEHFELYREGLFTAKTGLPYQLPYRLLKPSTIIPGKRYPLTVFLHGAGERGSDNKTQLTHGSQEFAKWLAKSKVDSYVLFPQCPTEEQWANHKWYEEEHTMKSTPTQSMNALFGLIDEIRANEPIDDDHILASGLSMGGFGVYDMVARRPGFFAAASAICGGSDCSPQFIEKLTKTRMYIIHGQADEIVTVHNSRNVVEALKKAGSEPRYLELPGIGHNCWTPIFNNDDFFNWLYEGVKPTEAEELAKVVSAAKSSPKRITNSFLKPKKRLGSAAEAKDVAGASSKAPSIRPKKNSVAKEQVVVAKPAIKNAKPAVPVKPVAPVKKAPLVAKKKPTVEAKKSVATKPVSKEPLAKNAAGKKANVLLGDWQVTSATHAGKVMSAKQTKSMAMEFDGENIVIKNGKKRETGKFEIGETVFTEGSTFAELEIKSNRKNVPSIKGFYTKNGDVLTMVWGAPGAKRPDPNVAEELDAARKLTLKPRGDNSKADRSDSDPT